MVILVIFRFKARIKKGYLHFHEGGDVEFILCVKFIPQFLQN